MNSGTKATQVTAHAADHQLKEALQKYARNARDLGHEEDVQWAILAIRAIDREAQDKARQKEILAEIDVRNALGKYIAIAESQGREYHVKAGNGALSKLNRNNFHAVYREIEYVERKLNDRVDVVVADKKKK